MNNLKIVFFGLGSIGKRHASLIKNNFDFDLFAFRSNVNSKKNDLGIKEIYSLKDLDEIKPDIAFITNPTYLHLDYINICMKRNISIFLEKPLYDNNDNDNNNNNVNINNNIHNNSNCDTVGDINNIDDTDLLTNLGSDLKKKKLFFYVAYCLRFHPVIVWLKNHLKSNSPLHISIYNSSFLPSWRKKEHSLDHYSANKKLGGGVISELSHEIDYLYYLFGKCNHFKGYSEKISNITNDAEDFLDLILNMDQNIFVSLHLDFFSRFKRRELILDFKDHSVVADLVNNSITLINDSNKEEINFKETMDDVYLSQLKYFFEAFKNNNFDLMNNIDESLIISNFISDIKKEVLGK